MLDFEEVINADFECSEEKNDWLKRTRRLSFEGAVRHIRQREILDADDHPNQERYPGQVMIVVNIENYAHLVPAVKTGSGYFLKTVIPSRKATRDYLR
ncbi:MAG: toxin [Chloroflexi bacterium]|nr:toxin [Chloroflexota bacterium]